MSKVDVQANFWHALLNDLLQSGVQLRRPKLVKMTLSFLQCQT